MRLSKLIRQVEKWKKKFKRDDATIWIPPGKYKESIKTKECISMAEQLKDFEKNDNKNGI